MLGLLARVLIGVALVAVTAGDAWGTAEIWRAIEYGDLEKVQALVSSDPELLNAREWPGTEPSGRPAATPLWRAIFDKRTDIARFLWDQSNKDDALAAAVVGDLPALEKLVSDSPALIAKTDDWGWTLLHKAAYGGHADVAEWLLAKGAELAPREDSRTPLHVAAGEGHADCVELLLSHVEDVNTHRTAHGQTALHFAAEGGHKEVALLLLAHGADVNAVGNWGQASLERAAWKGHLEIVELLLSEGADVNARTETGTTALYGAMRGEHYELARMLLQRGAEHSIFTAAGLGDVETVRQMLHDDPALVAARDSSRWECAPLHRAAEHGQVAAVKVLLVSGADVNALDGRQWVPLHLAAMAGHVEAARELIEGGARLNVADDHDYARTPLLLAAEEGHVDVVKLLMRPRTNLFAADKGGDNALLLAAQRGHLEVVELLIKSTFWVRSTNPFDGATALHGAAFGGHVDVARLLVSKGADVNARDEHGSTPLHKTTAVLYSPEAAAGQYAVAELLLLNGADVNARTDGGTTALRRAIHAGRYKLAALFRQHGGME